MRYSIASDHGEFTEFRGTHTDRMPVWSGVGVRLTLEEAERVQSRLAQLGITASVIPHGAEDIRIGNVYCERGRHGSPDVEYRVCDIHVEVNEDRRTNVVVTLESKGALKNLEVDMLTYFLQQNYWVQNPRKSS